MSVYRTLFTAMAACVIAAPVLANEPAAPAAPVAVIAANTSAHHATSAKLAADAKVNVNKAKAKELLNVKGVNPAIARAIVSYRKRHGEFKSLDDLVKVRVLKKMNPSDLKAIQDQLTV